MTARMFASAELLQTVYQRIGSSIQIDGMLVRGPDVAARSGIYMNLTLDSVFL